MSGKRVTDTNVQTRAIVHVPTRKPGPRAETLHVEVPHTDDIPHTRRPAGRYAEQYQWGLGDQLSEVPAIVFDVTR